MVFWEKGKSNYVGKLAGWVGLQICSSSVRLGKCTLVISIVFFWEFDDLKSTKTAFKSLEDRTYAKSPVVWGQVFFGGSKVAFVTWSVTNCRKSDVRSSNGWGPLSRKRRREGNGEFWQKCTWKAPTGKKNISVIFQFYFLMWFFASLHSPQRLFCSGIKRGHMTLQSIPECVT